LETYTVMPQAPSFTRRAVALLALSLGLGGAFAQTYPDRPITMIVPWGAGGGTDAVARR
jgi:tripartite-type tricarboxylate transporter receptor subunit TctC